MKSIKLLKRIGSQIPDGRRRRQAYTNMPNRSDLSIARFGLKSQRIELSSNTFAERTSYQVFTEESETFHCWRCNGKSHCKNIEQIPLPKKNFPFMQGHDVDRHLMPRSTPRTTPNRSSDGSRTLAQTKVPIGYNGAPLEGGDFVMPHRLVATPRAKPARTAEAQCIYKNRRRRKRCSACKFS